MKTFFNNIEFSFDSVYSALTDPVNTWKGRRVDPVTGLSKRETAILDRFIQENLPKWQKKLEEKGVVSTFRVEKEESGMPRTVHLIHDPSAPIRVMVLCKRKRVHPVGEGSFKKLTRSIEWQTKKMWAYANVGSDDLKSDLNVLNEWELERVAQSHPWSHHVKAPSIGLIPYKHQNKEKIGFFSPLRQGTFYSLLKIFDPDEGGKALTARQKMRIMRQCLEILCLLEDTRIEHRDIKTENLLFWVQNNQIQVELADFGLARQEHENMEPTDLAMKYRMAGSKINLPPEAKRAWVLAELERSTKDPKLQKAKNEIRDHCWEKTDVWGMGLILLALMEGVKFEESGLRAVDHIVKYAKARPQNLPSVLSDDDLFMQEIFQNKESLFKEPEKDTPLHLIWSMLQLDYRKRATPHDLLQEFERLGLDPDKTLTVSSSENTEESNAGVALA